MALGEGPDRLAGGSVAGRGGGCKFTVYFGPDGGNRCVGSGHVYAADECVQQDLRPREPENRF